MLTAQIRGVIFDVDGTLVLSNAAHAAAWSRAFSESRFFDVTPQDVRPLIGMGGEKLVAALKPRLDEARTRKILDAHKQIFQRDFLPKLKPAPGTRALLLDLSARGLRLAAASSAGKDDLAALLEAASVSDILTRRISADDVSESKPAPDVIQAALENLELESSEAVMVGDTPYDIEAAHAANVRVVALRCGGWDDWDLSAADAIFDDPDHLRASLNAPAAACTM